MAIPNPSSEAVASTVREARPAGEQGQLVLELGHTPSHAAVDFLVGDGNRLAHAHVLAYPNWPGPLTLIVGPPKSGKSHLARIWSARAGAVICGVGDIVGLARTGGQTPLVLEDVDRLAYDETALFHLLNQSMRDNRPLLMTARLPVGEWPYSTNDLLSRARLAAAFSVAPDDDMQLSQMFVKLFDDRQLTVDPKIITYLLARMERSFEEAVTLADLMDRLALARGSAITRSIAAEALGLRRAARFGAQGDIDLEGDDDE